jgi:phosphatidylglycerophosphatase C
MSPQSPVGPGDERPTVAAFDFDGTITRGGSLVPFLLTVRGPGPVAVAVVATFPKILRAAMFAGTAADRAKEALFGRLLSGLPAEQVDETAARFAERHLARRLRPEIRDRLDWHRKRGHMVVVVSGSPECYVKVAGELLGVDATLATRLSVGGGLLTGRYEGKNCRGAEKYARLLAWLRSEGVNGGGAEQPVLWVYGNSRGDLRLMSAADHGVDVGRLGRFGRLRRFPRMADVAGASAPA